MTAKVTDGETIEFGYYPIVCNITTERFSIQTLPSLQQSIARVENDPGVHKDWIYPGASLQHNFISEETHSLPYKTRIFGLPKTHMLTLYKSQNKEDLDFIVWCLSFFTGMRLTTTEAGFIDATPIKPRKLIDFVLSCCTLEDAINLAIDYLESERDNFRSAKRVTAAIHALFLSQFPQSLSFEKFQYVYMALDTCFKIIETKSNFNKRLNHAERVQWMCQNFDMPVPFWATTTNKKSDISAVRNDTIHEALFFDEPLGFSIYGGNQPSANSVNIIMQMQHLISRLIVAILGKPDIDYVKSSVESRMCEPLRLNDFSR